MPRIRQTKRAVPSPQPNDVSIAALIRIGPVSVLLGGDLENSGSSAAGWEAVITSHNQSAFGSPASLYKIAHHGSENAHNLDIWGKLLRDDPLAVLTPWRRGSTRLPTREGVKAILDQTRRAFATA